MPTIRISQLASIKANALGRGINHTSSQHCPSTKEEKIPVLEFTARVRDGQIEVPEEYRERLEDVETVKITLTPKRRTAAIGIITQLVENPIKVKVFSPFTREEAHERG
jgi:hypothetical protein